MADRTVVELYQDALKALQDTRQEFNSKLLTIEQLERELTETKSQLKTTATDLERTKQQLQTNATEIGATKSQLLAFDTTLTKALADVQSIRQGLSANTVSWSLQVEQQDSTHAQSEKFLGLPGFSGHIYVRGPGGNQQACFIVGADGNGLISSGSNTFVKLVERSVKMGLIEMVDEPAVHPNMRNFWRFKNLALPDNEPLPAMMTVTAVGNMGGV